MLTQEAREAIARATVRLPNLGGQGVLVPGGFVLTASHCVRWSAEGGMALGDYYLEPVETESGARFNLEPRFVDPVSDLALLGAPDAQEFGEDCGAFEAWQEQTQPIALADHKFEVATPLAVHVLSHLREWTTGTFTLFGFPGRSPPCGSLFLRSDSPIRGGTSGGPIVDDSGHLVAVVSHSRDVADGEPCEGAMPIASLALPRWAWALIQEAT